MRTKKGEPTNKGDTLESINNVLVSNYSLSDIRKLFSSRPNKILTLTIKRENKIFTKKIKLARQI